MQSPTFRPITRRTVSDEVREALVRSIQTGELTPGSRLPAERVLCEEFNVARTSVREAVQGLISLGLIEKRGNRAYVTENLPDLNLADDRRKGLVKELFEVREIVELPIARLAAERASESQRAEIADLAAAFDADMSLDRFRELDRAFHWSLASACGNRTLAELYGKVLDNLFKSSEFDELLRSPSNADAVREVIDSASRSHKKIARAIASGQPDEVETEAAAHLSEVEAHMIGKMA